MVLALEKSTSSLSLNELVTHYQSENSENAKEEIDPYTTIPTWESRSKCLMAYFVLMMNFWAILRYTYSIAVYGSEF